MGLPQFIFLALHMMSLGVHLARDGQSRNGETYSAAATLFVIATNLGLLYWGGFFG